MADSTWVLTDAAEGIYSRDFKQAVGGCSVTRRTLEGGKRQDVDLVEIDNGAFRFAVVPSRGMGLWKGWLAGSEIGWQSPVKGPVHPAFVPVGDPSGLGWLEGFDELLCRCGLVSNGAPEAGPSGAVQYPLHGRIANLPAHRVTLEIDKATGETSLTGEVDETRFLFQQLRLTATYKTKPGQKGLTIIDEVTNLSGEPAEVQLLYHINFGPPLLDPGAKFVAPVKVLVPRDPRAAEGVKSWETYPNEEPGFSEQVYFFQLAADDMQQTRVLLKNAHGTAGVGLRYDVRQLPCFTLWKNTKAVPDGYVTGLEPGTNYPNPRSFEGQQKRFVKLEPGARARFEIELELYDDAASVSQAEAEIAKLQQAHKPQIFDKPQAGWTRV